MSRIGRQPINIPEEVEIKLGGGKVQVKGPRGELEFELGPRIGVKKKNGTAVVTRRGNSRDSRSLHGLTRSLLSNAVVGVTRGHSKELKMVGVGYRAKKQGEKLILSVGFSHPVELEPPEGIKFELKDNTEIKVEGINKQVVGEVAARVRKIRPPEPYKGKGIRYKDEVVKKKPGKAAKAVGIGE